MRFFYEHGRNGSQDTNSGESGQDSTNLAGHRGDKEITEDSRFLPGALDVLRLAIRALHKECTSNAKLVTPM